MFRDRLDAIGPTSRAVLLYVVELAATADSSRDVELAGHPVVVQGSRVLIYQDDVLERLVEGLLCLERLGVHAASFPKEADPFHSEPPKGPRSNGRVNTQHPSGLGSTPSRRTCAG